MYLAYYDEAGDDGFPKYSSPLFVLSCYYLHQDNWHDTYAAIQDLRRQLRDSIGLPVKTEFHTKRFLLRKNPYKDLCLSGSQVAHVLDKLCQFVASLPGRIVNVVINKQSISSPKYEVLDRALTYSIQRVENDLRATAPSEKFMVITDEGRVGSMTKTTRRVQRINFIPSQYAAQPYRQEVKRLLEDPLPKESRQSYFIQLADMISYIVYLFCLGELGVGTFANRIPPEIDVQRVTQWLEMLKPAINLKASRSSPYGIVTYPK